MELPIKIDLHIHTTYSKDSLISLKKLHKICTGKNILPAITDHNTIQGALIYKKDYGNCIIGEEITTKEKVHLIGLFLKENIPANLSLQEACNRIKQQKGLICIPHPFDMIRGSSMHKIGFTPDLIEVFNSRASLIANAKAEKCAQENNIPKIVGSDAHTPKEIGRSCILIDNLADSPSPGQFLKSLDDALYIKNRSPFYLLALTKVIRIIRKAKTKLQEKRAVQKTEPEFTAFLPMLIYANPSLSISSKE